MPCRNIDVLAGHWPMKKVNKQCLLDTPRTVRVSEKTWQVIVQTSRPSKAVVGVGLCIYKHLIREKLSKFSLLSFCQKLFFLDQTPSCICSMCLHFIGKVSN